MNAASAQDIEVGPVRVDTGNGLLDIAAAAGLLVLAAVVVVFVRRFGGGA